MPRNDMVSVHSPKTTVELINTVAKNKNAVIFGGGTYLMSRDDYYPNVKGRDIILTSTVPELSRVYHSEKYIEAGCAVTLETLLSTGSYIISQPLDNALRALGSSTIRSQMTMGGAFCTDKIRFALPCYLSAIGAEVEFRFYSLHGRAKRVTSTSRWLSISKLYGNNGEYVLEDNAVMTRVRIPSQEGLRQFYRTLGSPMHESRSSVIFALTFNDSKGSISDASLRIVLPVAGFFASADFDSMLSGLPLPMTTAQINRLGSELAGKLKSSFPKVTNIQIERSRRLLQTILFDLNTGYLQF
ncbi:MAG: FAD binding domain-containing protein [Sphaerochaetaceae bacterium]|nr:FAD binding domain-containing protein [Sphaerochaetaceae bacterium]